MLFEFKLSSFHEKVFMQFVDLSAKQKITFFYLSLVSHGRTVTLILDESAPIRSSL